MELGTKQKSIFQFVVSYDYYFRLWNLVKPS